MSMKWTARTLFASLLAVCFLLSPFALTSAEDTAAIAEKAEEDLVPPQIILSTQKQPVYPPAARDARYTGSVLIEMKVLKDGSVGDAKVVACSRPKVGFEDAAIAAVRQWRFVPATVNGEAIDVATRLKLNFTRTGVGLNSKPQISAGSFTTEWPGSGSVANADRSSGSGSRSGGDVK